MEKVAAVPLSLFSSSSSPFSFSLWGRGCLFSLCPGALLEDFSVCHAVCFATVLSGGMFLGVDGYTVTFSTALPFLGRGSAYLWSSDQGLTSDLFSEPAFV